MTTKLILENTGDDNPFYHEAEAASFDRAAIQLLEEIILHYDTVPPDIYTALYELAMSDGDGEHVRSDFSTPEENAFS